MNHGVAVLNSVMTLRLAILGDSIAYGVGAAEPADTVAARLVRDLRATGWHPHERVYAVPGARSADLGRQARAATEWRPHVAVIIVGANDLTHFVSTELAARCLAAAVRALRAAHAQVVVAPAPDLSVVPHVPAHLRTLVQAGSRLLRRAQMKATLDEGGRIADADGSVSTAFAADPALFSADRFHPSSAGYARIAQALWPVVRAAAAATPLAAPPVP
jgi:lysophospholipase L1-like esterase